MSSVNVQELRARFQAELDRLRSDNIKWKNQVKGLTSKLNEWVALQRIQNLVCLCLCVSVFECLYVCLPFCLCVAGWLGVCLCPCLSFSLSVGRSMGRTVDRSVVLSVCLSVGRSIGLCLCLCTYVCICDYICACLFFVSVCPSVSLPLSLSQSISVDQTACLSSGVPPICLSVSLCAPLFEIFCPSVALSVGVSPSFVWEGGITIGISHAWGRALLFLVCVHPGRVARSQF